MPAYFDQKDLPPPPEGEMNVMITSLLFHKDSKGHFDRKRPPKCMFIRAITEDDVFVNFDGFECSGSMAQTLSSAKTQDGRTLTITPGRLHDFLNVAFNMGDNQKPLTPGTGWVRVNPQNGMWRLEGVNSLKELSL